MTKGGKKYSAVSAEPALPRQSKGIENHFFSLFLYTGIYGFLLISESRFGLLADYFLFVGQLTSNRIYFLKNGFFHIPYYLPTFGGGLPGYADPQDMYFSIVQILYNLLPDPYTAFKTALFVCLVLSYFGAYFFLKKVGVASKWMCSFGALVFSLNGFVMSRWIIGHLTFHAYWIAPWVLLNLYTLYQGASVRESISASLWMAFLLAVSIYAADINTLYHVILLGFTLFVALQIQDRQPAKLIKPLAYALFVTGPMTVFLTASKVSAMLDYLRQFPRHLENNVLTVKLILWILPNCLFNPTLDISSDTPMGPAAWHEYCAYVGVGILVCLVLGFALQRKRVFSSESPTLKTIQMFLIWSLILIPLVGYLIMGQNLAWTILKRVPIVSSYHMVSRFLGTFPLVVVGFAMAFLSHWRVAEKRIWLSSLLGIFCLFDILFYTVNIDTSAHKSAFTPVRFVPVENVRIEQWGAGTGGLYLDRNVGDFWAVQQQFGFGGRASNVDPNKPPLTQLEDGTFNINDPVSMMYPDHTGRPAWSRLPVAGNQEKARQFLAFEDPDFYIPPKQKIANLLSIITFLFGAALLLFLHFKPEQPTT